MGSFGEILRREREMRGISLAEISRATKISARLLQAIETSRYEQLPGGIFDRSFVRQYARYLGLDEDRVVAEFELAYDQSSEPLDWKRLAVSASATPESEGLTRGAPSRARLIFAALLGTAALAVAVWKAWTLFVLPERGPSSLSSAAPAAAPSRPAGTPQAAPAPSPVLEGPAPPPASAPEEGAGPATTPADGANARPTTETASAASSSVRTAGPLRLQLDTVDSSWVAAYVDGRKAWEAELQPGVSRTLTAGRSVTLRVGNAAALVLTLNGETLPPLGRKGEVRTVTYTAAEKAQKPSPGNRP